MTAALAEPLTRPRDFIARMTGLGRPVLWSLAATSFISTVAAVAAGGWAWHEARTSADRARVFVAQIDSAGTMIGRFEVAADWSPDVGAYLGFVQRWVRDERGRPSDEPTLVIQRQNVIFSTDQRVYGALNREMHEADLAYGKTGVDISDLAVNMVEQREGQAVLLARWTEHPRGGAVAPTAWAATITVAHLPPKTVVEYGRNPLGLFVTQFQETQVQMPGNGR